MLPKSFGSYCSENSTIVGTTLRGLKLRGLKLRGLKLRGLKLRGLKLRGLKLRGLKLCRGLHQNDENVAQARSRFVQNC
jgi:uncharacterized protein YjbI with pentapeptide repeats